MDGWIEEDRMWTWRAGDVRKDGCWDERRGEEDGGRWTWMGCGGGVLDSNRGMKEAGTGRSALGWMAGRVMLVVSERVLKGTGAIDR